MSPKTLIALGILFIVIGLLWHFGLLKSFPFGRLPGDIAIEKEHSRFYFPITSSIILSIALSALIYLLQKFK